MTRTRKPITAQPSLKPQVNRMLQHCRGIRMAIENSAFLKPDAAERVIRIAAQEMREAKGKTYFDRPFMGGRPQARNMLALTLQLFTVAKLQVS
jgi:hypothetical protein